MLARSSACAAGGRAAWAPAPFLLLRCSQQQAHASWSLCLPGHTQGWGLVPAPHGRLPDGGRPHLCSDLPVAGAGMGCARWHMGGLTQWGATRWGATQRGLRTPGGNFECSGLLLCGEEGRTRLDRLPSSIATLPAVQQSRLLGGHASSSALDAGGCLSCRSSVAKCISGRQLHALRQWRIGQGHASAWGACMPLPPLPPPVAPS